MTTFAKDMIRKLARRIATNPHDVMPGDAYKLAKACLALMGEKL